MRLPTGHNWGTFATSHEPEMRQRRPTGLGTCREPPSRYAPGADEPLRVWSRTSRDCPADSSALLRLSVGHGSLVTKDHREVGPLSGGVMLQPLSDRLPVGVGLLPNPLPAGLSGGLTTPLPGLCPGNPTSLPRCVAETAWVRPCLYAGGPTAAPGEFGAPGPDHIPFDPSLSASLACPC